MVRDFLGISNAAGQTSVLDHWSLLGKAVLAGTVRGGMKSDAGLGSARSV